MTKSELYAENMFITGHYEDDFYSPTNSVKALKDKMVR